MKILDIDRLLLSLILAFITSQVTAQVLVENEDDEDDEITVTDQEGREEVIEFPEAMTYDLDSLMNLYLSKTYLEEDSDCNMQKVNPEFSKEEYM